MNFAHLHNHSEYSSLDGFSQIKDIVSRVKDLKQSSIALTDHGNLNGSYKFYQECVKKNIKPIMGVELYVCKEYDDRELFHLTLLAQNNNGWQSLLKLHKISYENFYYKPRVSFEDLFKYKNGLICLSGCPSGILSKLIRKDIDPSQHLEMFANEFEHFYIEKMDHGLKWEQELNLKLDEIAGEIQTVITNDCHYTIKEHAKFQDYLICDQLKINIDTEHQMRPDVQEYYIKSRQEMPGTEDEKDTTTKIAEMCCVEFPKKQWMFTEIEDKYEKFNLIISKAIKKHNLNDEYIERLRKEYRVITEANLIDYFLTVHDFIQFAESKGILVGPGRGSVGGSLIAYLMGIHKIDPIKHGLIFSRFYNEGRKGSLPDIDTDFPEKDIEKVRQYIVNKYGKENIAHIGTYTYLHPKSSIKLLSRVKNIEFKQANNYSSVIEDEKQTENLRKIDPVFNEIAEESEIIDGLATYASVHAAGIIISPTPLENHIPLRTNANGLYISAWDMEDVENNGFVKYDFLSLNTLDVVSDTLKLVGIKISDVPMNDIATFNSISTTNNVGIFQIGKEDISKVANDIGIESIDDIAAAVALYRPGPIYSGLHTKYIKRKHGEEPIEYDHPLLKSVLEDTYGLFIYQEQIIKAAIVLANFTETEADTLRKAMGKKKKELMLSMKEKFLQGCLENNIDNAQEIWDQIDLFSSYSFNLSHSVAYGYITYYTAYLKTHYPAEYMASLMNNNYNKKDKMLVYLRECKNLGIDVMPPSLNSYNFTVKNDKIIFGMNGITGIGNKTAEEISKYKYDSFDDFCLKFKPGSSLLSYLAEAGVFDEFGLTRKSVITHSKNIAEQIKKKKKIYNKKSSLLFKPKKTISVPSEKEFDTLELARMEYDRLNTFLLYNPLSSDLATPEELAGNVFIEGYLCKIKPHITKKKQTMAFLTIATNLGEIEALMFPQTYLDYQYEIEENKYVAIDGTYEDKLIVNKIWTK